MEAVQFAIDWKGSRLRLELQERNSGFPFPHPFETSLNSRCRLLFRCIRGVVRRYRSRSFLRLFSRLSGWFASIFFGCGWRRCIRCFVSDNSIRRRWSGLDGGYRRDGFLSIRRRRCLRRWRPGLRRGFLLDGIS